MIEEEDESKALSEHLGVVSEKIKLCREVLLESPGIQEDELLSSIIGFLEACSERMPDLIEAGAASLISEELFEEVLRVNDALIRTLEAEKTGSRIAVDDDAPKATEANLLDLDQDSTPAPAVAAASKPASKVQASLIDVDEDSGLDYKSTSSSNSKTVREIAGNYSKGTSLKPVGDHRGSSFSHTPSGTTPAKAPLNDSVFAEPTPMDEIFGNSASSVNDIDLLLSDDAKHVPQKKDDDFDSFLDSIGEPSKGK